MEGWLVAGAVVLFLIWMVRRTKRRNSDPQLRETAVLMESCARGYFSLTEPERNERDARLLEYLYAKKARGAGLRDLAHPVSMLHAVLSTDERAHLAELTEYVYSHSAKPLASHKTQPPEMTRRMNTSEFGEGLSLERPYQIAPDGRISMSWTNEATLRTAEHRKWVAWQIDDPQFASKQTIWAFSGMDFEIGKAVRSIVWANEDVGLVILDSVLDSDETESGSMFSFPSNFIYSPKNLSAWLHDSIKKLALAG